MSQTRSNNQRVFSTPLKVVNKTKKSIERIAVFVTGGMHLINVKNIIHCQADGNYCKIRLVSGVEIYCAKTLKSVELKLDNQKFKRTHHSHLVNMDLIEFVSSDWIRLNDQSLVPVSKSKRAEIFKFLEDSII